MMMSNNNNNNNNNNILNQITQKATIKGILALIIGGGGFIVLAILSVLGQEGIETLRSILLMIIGFYFGETTAKSK